jgi:hypothetical protein
MVLSRAECSVDLKLGGLGEIGAADGTTTKEPMAATAAPSTSPMKRPRLGPGGAGGAQCQSCAVDGCKADLSKCRDYHRRHKVCETHSKTPIVVITGREMRFCQQLSRYSFQPQTIPSLLSIRFTWECRCNYCMNQVASRGVDCLN